jgi:hypothetical protein
MDVSIGDRITFRFPSSLSITSLVVTNSHEDIVWQFIAEEFQPVETVGGSFQSWPIDQAPPELLKMVADIQAKADRELAQRGPRKTPMSEVMYGELPDGYREESPPLPLVPGEYNVLVFGEQGSASARFRIT